jgi:hypothetical protein
VAPAQQTVPLRGGRITPSAEAPSAEAPVRTDGAGLSELLRVEERCAAAEGGSTGAQENTGIIGDSPALPLAG